LKRAALIPHVNDTRVNQETAPLTSHVTAADIDPKLLEILVCPITKGPLEYDRAAGELISRKAGLAYPIRDGIPIMLADEARQLEE
jgi:uncharacterized protein